MNDYTEELSRLSFLEMTRGLSKTLPYIVSSSVMQNIRNELKGILANYKEEFKIEAEIPEIHIRTKGNTAYFDFKDPITGKNVYLISEWFYKRKRALNG